MTLLTAIQIQMMKNQVMKTQVKSKHFQMMRDMVMYVLV